MSPRILLGLTVVALALCATVACGSPRLGVADIHADGSACVVFRGAPLKAGTPVLVILFGPPRIVDGVVRPKATEPCNPALDPDEHSYTVQLRYKMGDMAELGVAIDSPGARAEYEAGQFLVKTRDAKTPLTVRQCTSHEGVHLSAWRGGRRTWHTYWYLGYDVEPTCTEEDSEEWDEP